MKLEQRDYQTAAENYAIDHGIDDKVIHCAPTGSGKTVMQARIAKREMDRGNSTAILTPRNEIFTQTRGVCSSVCGIENVSILRAKRRGERWDPVKPVHVVSWHTLISRVRRSKFWFPDVRRVDVDECHLSMAPKILEILEHYAPKAVLDGWTATPSRQTGKGLGRFFTEIKHVTSVRRLIKEGHLCPVEYWGGNTPDMEGIKIVRGDYEIGKLSRASQKLVGDVVDNWLRLAADRHTIVFSVDVAHCEMLTHRFKSVGIRAAALHSHMGEEDRDEVVALFKAGAIQVLVNVQIASYGFDDPSVNCIVIARKTRSIVLHLQMIGRGMRPALDENGDVIRDPDHPDFKTCMVLDHAGNVPALGQADDLFRWRLDAGKKASARVNEKGEPEEPKSHVCEGVLDSGLVCGWIFSGSRVCPQCGWKVPFTKKDVETKEADLVRIGKKMVEKLPKGWPSHEVFFCMLAHYGAMRKKPFKPGYAMAMYKEKVGEWPPRHWGGMAMVPPSKRVLNWITNRNIAHRHDRKKAEQKTGVSR